MKGSQPSLQVRRNQLKERLLKFKSVKEEKKERQRKETAKSLKYMRKLGRKLRHPVFRKIKPNS